MLRHRINCPRHTRTSFVSTLYTCVQLNLSGFGSRYLYMKKKEAFASIFEVISYIASRVIFWRILWGNHIFCVEGNKKLTSSFLSGLLQSRPHYVLKLQILYYVTSLTLCKFTRNKRGRPLPEYCKGNFLPFL